MPFYDTPTWAIRSFLLRSTRHNRIPELADSIETLDETVNLLMLLMLLDTLRRLTTDGEDVIILQHLFGIIRRHGRICWDIRDCWVFSGRDEH